MFLEFYTFKNNYLVMKKNNVLIRVAPNVTKMLSDSSGCFNAGLKGD